MPRPARLLNHACLVSVWHLEIGQVSTCKPASRCVPTPAGIVLVCLAKPSPDPLTHDQGMSRHSKEEEGAQEMLAYSFHVRLKVAHIA